MGLSALGVVVLAGSFSLQDIVEAQRSVWFAVLQPVGLVEPEELHALGVALPPTLPRHLVHPAELVGDALEGELIRQAAEIDLSRFKGAVPIELTGHSPFPPIGELPYLLTLPAHGFFWFLLAAGLPIGRSLAEADFATVLSSEDVPAGLSVPPVAFGRNDDLVGALNDAELRPLPGDTVLAGGQRRAERLGEVGLGALDGQAVEYDRVATVDDVGQIGVAGPRIRRQIVADGIGAWTKKCQHTSWWNETLNGTWVLRTASATAGSSAIR